MIYTILLFNTPTRNTTLNICLQLGRDNPHLNFIHVFYVHHRYVLLPSAACWISKQSGNEQILLEFLWRGRVKIGSIWGSAWEMFSETNERHRRLLTPRGDPPGGFAPGGDREFCTSHCARQIEALSVTVLK